MSMRPCWVEIDTKRLEANFQFLQILASPHADLLAIVKGNAYGHGLSLCAAAAVRGGARWLGVTSVEEGIAARAACPETRVLVLGGVFPGQGVEVVSHNLTAVVWESGQFAELESAARKAGAKPNSIPVHLEIDTGMSRQGVDSESLAQALAQFHPGSPLKLEGVMTHLFAADEADARVTDAQLDRLDKVLGEIGAAGLLPEWLNVGNSAALVAGQAETIGDLASRHGMRAMLRPGLALYGLVPDFDPDFDQVPPTVAAAKASLKPVLSWKTRVISLRSVSAGAVVGYNGTFLVTEPMRLALIAVGYADGLDRHLGNRFSLLVRGQQAPLAGRISMDQAVLDVSDIPGVDVGDEVVILGSQGDQTITSFDHAQATGTIPWEVFTRIGERVKRVEV
jgi:alanine racemase